MHGQYLYPRGLLYPYMQLLSFLGALFPTRIGIFRVPQSLLCFPRLFHMLGVLWILYLTHSGMSTVLCTRLVSGPSESKSPVPRIAPVLWMPSHHLPCQLFLAPSPATFFCSNIPLGFVGHQCLGAQVLEFTVVAADKGNVGRLDVPAIKSRDPGAMQLPGVGLAHA